MRRDVTDYEVVLGVIAVVVGMAAIVYGIYWSVTTSDPGTFAPGQMVVDKLTGEQMMILGWSIAKGKYECRRKYGYADMSVHELAKPKKTQPEAP